jgi:hypothetical protein
MLAYASLNYLAGGPVFFVFLQSLAVFASILMMLDTPNKVAIPLICTTGAVLIIWSLYLFDGYNNIFFILGLTGIGIGYTLSSASSARPLALTAGAALIAIFSLITASWIFFGLNVFFAIFSAYYALRALRR